MKTSCLAIVALILGGAVAIAAQPAGKKGSNAPQPKAPATDADDSAADSDESGDEGEKKPAKKPAKQGTALKLSTGEKKPADDAEIIKTYSYMQGFGMGKQIAQFHELGIDLDVDVVIEALKEGVSAKESVMTEEKMHETMTAVQKLVHEKVSAKNKREGHEFLANNKKEEGVKTLPSGLQYKVIKSGKGESPRKSDTVRAHYKGTLLNGMEFDSSYRRGRPETFPVGGVIKGWNEALQLMKIGDKWQLFIPSELAYGEEGRHDQQGNTIIPPNATLVFDVELLGIEKGRAPSLK